MILTRIYGYGCVVLLAACLFLYAMWQHADNRRLALANELGQAAYNAQVAARKAEQRQAQAVAAIADKYEQDKRAVDEAQRKLVSDLRAGTVRLRNLWQGCQATDRVSGAAASAAESDAAARDREESAGRIVRAARDADDRIRALQELVRQDRR